MFEQITSFQNPRVKQVKSLRDKRDREKSGLFVIDDDRDLERALACNYEVEFAFFCPELTAQPFDFDIPHRRVFEVSREIMEKAAYRTNPSAILAVMHAKAMLTHAHLDGVKEGPILGLVNLQKPGNIGALMRTADASGFTSVFLIDSHLDLYNPNIIRSSTATCFLENVYSLSSAHAIPFFKSKGYQIAAAHLQGDKSLYEVKFPRRTAVILGTEDIGLSDEWVQHCDQLVKIPMVGQMADSLNVSVSGAIFMYEVFRQQMSN